MGYVQASDMVYRYAIVKKNIENRVERGRIG